MAFNRTPRRTKRDAAIVRNNTRLMYAANPKLEPAPELRVRKPRIGPSEHQLQVAVIQWWRLACKGYGLPEFALFAIPNGGARDVITGSRLKAEGVRRGIPDLMLAAHSGGNHGLFLEMKRADGRQSEYQEEIEHFLNEQAYIYAECNSSEKAIAIIKDYLA